MVFCCRASRGGSRISEYHVKLANKYRGATLPQLIQHQIKSMNEKVILQAVRGTYEHFPLTFRPQADSFSLAYAEQWFGPDILTADLGDIYLETIRAIKRMAFQAEVELNDDQLFDMFNLIVMRVTYFAHTNPGFRKQYGIKKGWFS